MKTRKLTLFALAAIAALATSCSNDELNDNNNQKGIVINATAGTPQGGIDTRLTHTDGSTSMDIVWAAGDAFTVYGGSEKHNYTLVGSGGSASASFDNTNDLWVTAPTGGIYALYPTNATSSSPSAITLSLEGQTGALTGLKDYNYMTASTTYTTGDLNFGAFAHRVAIVKLVLTFPNDVTATEATQVGLKGTGINKSVQIDLTNNIAISNPNAGDVTTGANPIPITNHTLTTYLCLFPNSLTDVKAVATADGKDYSVALSNLTIVAGRKYTATATLTGKVHPTDAFDNEAPYGDADGSEYKPYEIATKEQLTLLATLINSSISSYAGAYYILTDDINLNNSDWTPIGIVGYPFDGYFNGNGHTISNLEVSGSHQYAGLFGYITKYVYALNVTGNIASSRADSQSGGICATNQGAIVGCSFSGTVSGDNRAGGIAGYTNSTSSHGFVAGCYSTATSVTATSAGGVVGYNDCIIDNGKKGNYYCFWQAGASVPAIASDYQWQETCAMFTAAEGITEAQVTAMNNAITELGCTNFRWKYTPGQLLPVIEMIP